MPCYYGTLEWDVLLARLRDFEVINRLLVHNQQVAAEKAQAEKRSHTEIRTAARLLAQGHRDSGSLFALLPPEINVKIASFTRDPQAHSDEEAYRIATQHFCKPYQ